MTRPTHLLAPLLATIALVAVTTAAPAAAQDATPPDPGFETNGALPWEEPPGALEFIVWDVVDGDTIRVIEPDQKDERDPYWEPVRIIGIDTPEKDGPYTDAECYGPEASDFTTSLMPRGTVVYLQVDNDPNIPDDREFLDTGMELDDNDRWLVHVYLKAETSEDYYLVSEIVALGGYAEVPGYEGNTYFERELADAEDLAREENRGMWGACDL
jgi:micrococcal nuclease